MKFYGFKGKKCPETSMIDSTRKWQIPNSSNRGAKFNDRTVWRLIGSLHYAGLLLYYAGSCLDNGN